MHELVELQVVDGHRDEEDERDVGHCVEALAFDLVHPREVSDVADDGGDDHGTDVGGKRDVVAEVVRDDSAEAHGERRDGDRPHDLIREVWLRGCVLFRNVGVHVVGEVQLGFRLLDFVGSLHLVAADAPFAERAADEKGGDHAEGGGGDGNGGAARDAVGFLKIGTEGSGGAEAAHHGDGARENAVVLVKAHGFRYGHAHAVLEKHKYRDREEEAEKEPAAVLDDAKAGHQADGREEAEHEHGLQRRVDLNLDNVEVLEEGDDDGKGHAAHHGTRDGIA